MNDENSVEVLKEAIQATLDDPLYKQNNDLKGQIISGKDTEPYTISLLHTFETAVVEKLVINIFKQKQDNKYTIGWEIPYILPDWEGQKLDLGLGHVKESGYFMTAIEIKKCIIPDKIDPDKGGWVPYNIWNDIFKIIGYHDATNEDIGHNKFVLVFFVNHNTEETLENIFKETFITHCYFNTWMKIQMKNKEAIANNIYEFFLKTEQGWGNDKKIARALELLGLRKGDDKTEFIELEPKDKVFYIPENKIGAALLRVKGV